MDFNAMNRRPRGGSRLTNDRSQFRMTYTRLMMSGSEL